MECRDLSANLRDRGVAGTQMIEYIVKPHLCVIVKEAGDAAEDIFRRADGERIQPLA